MQGNTTLKNLAIFTGYSHIGSCREFLWIAGDMIGNQQLPSRFIIRGLTCEYDVEALMIRKDLYLRTDAGQEYIVNNFQITDISDIENISGIAENMALLFEKFPDMKTVVDGEHVAVTKQTQVMAFKVVSNVVNSVRTGQSIEAAPSKEVASHLVGEILASPDAIINLIDIKSFDDYTFTHNINVATIAIMIGHAMDMKKDDLHELGTGALLHDVGKLKVSLSILNKDGKLTDSEFAEMKRHSVYGYEILCRSVDLTERSRQVALLHHERFGGSGYPKGLKGRDIPLFARITTIADVYDALTTDRPYRVSMTPYDAIKIVMSGVDNQFDPEVLQHFIRRLSLYPNGSLVKLNDGSIGMVLRANRQAVMRPVIKILRDKNGVRLKQRQEIDLMSEKTLFIAGPATLAMLNVTAPLQA
ncbi:MAG TPA: HD-GYP domain-containing protein [Candidatus Ozemobacteraceae bacterium]|nr:HD-GYP domain-containing protein [Candidatus Ozemobacteraceae bacterium]